MAKIKHGVICRSGALGWQAKLHDVYKTFEEFDCYSEIYGIAPRIGYKTTRGAWKSNPTIQGSCNPLDLRKVKV